MIYSKTDLDQNKEQAQDKTDLNSKKELLGKWTAKAIKASLEIKVNF